MSDYSNYPYRDCIKCEGLGDCPEPKVLEDGFGTVVYPDYCPKSNKINVKLLISRTYLEDCTKGSMFVLDGDDLLFRCKCIELPDRGNEHDISCIPEGTYKTQMVVSSKHGTVFLLLDVPHRMSIEIHPGNYVTGEKIDSKGCILPGGYFVDLNDDGFTDVAESKIAMNTLLHILPGEFETIII